MSANRWRLPFRENNRCRPAVAMTQADDFGSSIFPAMDACLHVSMNSHATFRRGDHVPFLGNFAEIVGFNRPNNRRTTHGKKRYCDSIGGLRVRLCVSTALECGD